MTPLNVFTNVVCVTADHLCFLPKKHALMEQVAHQTIVMQFILELAKSLKVDPRGCFRQFFAKIKVTLLWIIIDL